MGGALLAILLIILVMLPTDALTPVKGTGITFIYILLGPVAAYLYLKHTRRPSGAIEIPQDTIKEFEDDRIVTGVPTGPDVMVDVTLNETTRSEEYGHLFGFRFERGDSSIVLSPEDEWDLWDIQQPWRP